MMLTANEERMGMMEADKGKRLSVKNMHKRVESKIIGEEELKNTQ